MTLKPTKEGRILIQHLTIRVAWHDNRWNGSVCTYPSQNPYCLTLKRIREKRDDAKENGLSHRLWKELGPDDLTVMGTWHSLS
jgi:isopentenyldiphosphate isomerase